jgi:hypothetical protein
VTGASLQNVTATGSVDVLTGRGWLLRVAATVAGALVLLAGTVVGTDDDFPFGPFRMYATTDKPDAPVADTRVEAVDATGHPLVLTEAETGIRRAEIEGQVPQFTTDPARLSVVDRAYRHHRPDAASLSEIAIVVRWHELRGGRPTGRYHDETLVTWRP